MIDPTNPAPYCDPCKTGLHADCHGWAEGFCSCANNLCLLRLRTGVRWTLHVPNQREEPS